MKKKPRKKSHRVLGTRDYDIDTAKPDDWSLPPPGKSSKALERKMIQALEEAIEDGCDGDLPGLCSCIRYARDNKEGVWDELEFQLEAFGEFDQSCEPLLCYIATASHRRNEWLERDFFLAPSMDKADDFAEYIRMGLVPPDDEAFGRSLLKCAKTDAGAMWVAINYAKTMPSGRWPDLDAMVKAWECQPAPTVEYALAEGEVGGWWALVEDAVKGRPHNDRWAMGVVVEYAHKVKKGRWNEEEERLKLSPECLFEYADRALQGRLPDDLHEAMERHRVLGLVRDERYYVEQYFQEYGG